MAKISRKTYERNDVETIVGNGGRMRLNKEQIEEGLDYKNVASDYSKTSFRP